jgi:hypothetical protein
LQSTSQGELIGVFGSQLTAEEDLKSYDSDPLNPRDLRHLRLIDYNARQSPSSQFVDFAWESINRG